MNKRNKLKSAIKKQIEDFLGYTVETTRFYPIDPKTEFPIVLVYSLEDSATPSDDLTTYQIESDIGVVVYARGDTADTDIDDMTGLIEDLLCRPMCQLTDDSGAVIVQNLIYEGVKIQPNSKTEIDVLVASMRFKATHFIDILEDPES